MGRVLPKSDGLVIQIEKGIPIPTGRAVDEIPFAAMQVGDSCVVYSRSASGFRKRARRFGIEVTVRAIECEDGNPKRSTAFRVWRIA
jgi:hypothetical protein